MSAKTLEDCFRELGLPLSAGAGEIKRAFRRLAKAHHPDLQRGRADGARFVRIVEAYARLREEFRLQTADEEMRPCPGCDRVAELLEGVDGQVACIDCLLGVSRRRFLLPFPVITTVKHAVVIALEGVSIVCLGVALVRGSTTYAAVSLATGLAALAALALACITIRNIK